MKSIVTRIVLFVALSTAAGVFGGPDTSPCSWVQGDAIDLIERMHKLYEEHPKEFIEAVVRHLKIDDSKTLLIDRADPQVKYALWLAHEGTDWYTKKGLALEEMTIDHVIPQSLWKKAFGESSDPNHLYNVVPTHKSNNQAKADSFDVIRELLTFQATKGIYATRFINNMALQNRPLAKETIEAIFANRYYFRLGGSVNHLFESADPPVAGPFYGKSAHFLKILAGVLRITEPTSQGKRGYVFSRSSEYWQQVLGIKDVRTRLDKLKFRLAGSVTDETSGKPVDVGRISSLLNVIDVKGEKGSLLVLEVDPILMHHIKNLKDFGEFDLMAYLGRIPIPSELMPQR